jgi:hypothetical protein
VSVLRQNICDDENFCTFPSEKNRCFWDVEIINAFGAARWDMFFGQFEDQENLLGILPKYAIVGKWCLRSLRYYQQFFSMGLFMSR